MRVRSFSAARRTTSARAEASSRAERMMVKNPYIAQATSGMVTSMSQSAPVCHAGIIAGRMTTTTVIPATNSGPLRPPRAIASTAMNTHITSASSWAMGTSSSVRPTITAIASHVRRSPAAPIGRANR